MRLLAVAEAMSLIDLEHEDEASRARDAASSGRIDDRARAIADSARVRAFEVLGDRPRAVAIMERRLREGEA